jgi:hypothetical protein
MKKKLFLFSSLIVGAAAVIIGGSNIKSDHFEKNLLLENIEALARAEAKKYDCYSILEGSGQSISCSTCKMDSGTPPWYHFGSTCYN